MIFTETSPSPRLGHDHWASDPYSLLVASGQKEIAIRRPHAPGLTNNYKGCPRSVDPETASSGAWAWSAETDVPTGVGKWRQWWLAVGQHANSVQHALSRWSARCLYMVNMSSAHGLQAVSTWSACVLHAASTWSACNPHAHDHSVSRPARGRRRYINAHAHDHSVPQPATYRRTCINEAQSVMHTRTWVSTSACNAFARRSACGPHAVDLPHAGARGLSARAWAGPRHGLKCTCARRLAG